MDNEEMKVMKKIISTVTKEWGKLSPAGRTYVKSQLENLDVNAEPKTDEEKERV